MVKSSQPPDVSCTLAAWPPLQDFSNQSTLSKSNVQNKPWVVSTLSWTEREVTSSLKNRLQEPQCSRSRLTCLSTNPSVSFIKRWRIAFLTIDKVSIPNFVLPLPVKLSHNVASITGRQLSKIHWKKEILQTRSSLQQERERVFQKNSHHSIVSWTNYKQLLISIHISLLID